MSRTSSTPGKTPLIQIKEAIREAGGRCLGVYTQKGNTKSSIETWQIAGRTFILESFLAGGFNIYRNDDTHASIADDIAYIQALGELVVEPNT